MARRQRLEGAARQWAGDAESVWTGMADWRAAHPKATFSEIEAALDERLDQVRARVLADLALASASADVAGESPAERPRCERCGTVLQARGVSDRTMLTHGGGGGAAPSSLRRLSDLRGRVFPPSTMSWSCCRGA